AKNRPDGFRLLLARLERTAVVRFGDLLPATPIGAYDRAEDLLGVAAGAKLFAERTVELEKHDLDQEVVIERAGHRNLAHFSPERLESSFEAAEVVQQADAQPAHFRFDFAQEIASGRERFEHDRAISHRPRERTDDVQALGARKHPFDRNAAERRARGEHTD